MLSRSLYIFCLFLLTSPLMAQSEQQVVNSYNTIWSGSGSKSAKISNTLSWLDSITPSGTEGGFIYYDFAKKFWPSDKETAIRYGEKALKLLENSEADSEELRSKNAFNLGLFYSNLNTPNYRRALSCFDMVIADPAAAVVRRAKAFREKGNIFDLNGDFKKALDNYYASQELLAPLGPSQNLLKTLVNISGTIANVQEADLALEFIDNQKRIKNLRQQVAMTTTQEAKIAINSGVMAMVMDQPERAKAEFDKGLSLAQQAGALDEQFRCLNNLSVLFKNQGKTDQANSMLNKAETLAKDNAYLMSSLYNNRAELALQVGSLKAAFEFNQRAIQQLIPQFVPANINQRPELSALANTLYKQDVLGYLIDIGSLWLEKYEASLDSKNLAEAAATFALCDQLIDQLFSESSETLSKLFWRKKGAKFYKDAVRASYLQQLPEQAYHYMEKNKSRLLLQQVLDLQAITSSNLPPEIASREYDLKKIITELVRKMDQSEPDQNSGFQDIIKAKRHYRLFLDSLRLAYPEYQVFKQRAPEPELENLQTALKSDQKVLQYSMGSDYGYALLISKDDIRIKEIAIDAQLLSNIDRFQVLTSRPFSDQNEKAEFHELGASLLSRLIPFNDLLGKQSQFELAIIPDGILYGLSFEALSLGNSEVLEDDYLIQWAEVYYPFSNALSQLDYQLSSAKDILELAPGQFQNNYLTSLSHNQSQDWDLPQNLRVNSLQNSKATLQNFTKAYSSSQIVHISTHGGIDQNGPWLAMYDKKLALNELFFKADQKSLVVLSACKTQQGKRFDGEGAFSLARAFKTSGTESVVSAFWNINEKATQQIIADFYGRLTARDTKANALRSAKLNFLNENRNTSLAAPFYWAGIGLNGINNKLEFASSPLFTTGNILLTFLLLIFAVLIVIGLKRLF